MSLEASQNDQFGPFWQLRPFPTSEQFNLVMRSCVFYINDFEDTQSGKVKGLKIEMTNEYVYKTADQGLGSRHN